MGKSVNKFIVRLGDSSLFNPKPGVSVKPVKGTTDKFLIRILHPNSMVKNAEGKMEVNPDLVLKAEEVVASSIDEAMRIGREMLLLPEILAVRAEWIPHVAPPKPRKGKMKLKTKEEASVENEEDNELLDDNFEFANTESFDEAGEKIEESSKTKETKKVAKKVATKAPTKKKAVASKPVNKNKDKNKKKDKPKKIVKAVSNKKKKVKNNKKKGK